MELPKSVDSSYCEDVETLNSFDEDPEVLIIFLHALSFQWLVVNYILILLRIIITYPHCLLAITGH